MDNDTQRYHQCCNPGQPQTLCAVNALLLQKYFPHSISTWETTLSIQNVDVFVFCALFPMYWYYVKLEVLH